MAQKKTNLAVAADVPTAQEMLQLADSVKPFLPHNVMTVSDSSHLHYSI